MRNRARHQLVRREKVAEDTMFRSVQLCDGAYEEALVWVDRNGREDPVPAPPRSYGSLSTVESSWRGMIQRREHLPLAFEPGEPSEVCRKGIGKHLQRIVPFERRVPGAPHAPHAALSDAGDDLIEPEAKARGQGHGRRHSTPNGCAGYREDAQVVWLTSNVTAIAADACAGCRHRRWNCRTKSAVR